jgi:uncharacterized membrane protein
VTAERFRVVISGVLIVGVGISAALVALGFIASLAVGWSGSLVGAGPSADRPSDFSSVLDGLIAVRPIALAQAGLLVLVATPVIRVVASVIGFAMEGDRTYVAITMIVLCILLLSLFGLR